jgi:hypothetical protein
MSTQPKPTTIATDATFTSGVDVGLATKSAPLAGRLAQGYGKRDHFGGPKFNWLINDIQTRLDAIEGMAALNFPERFDFTATGMPVGTQFRGGRLNLAGESVAHDLLFYTDIVAGTVSYCDVHDSATGWIALPDPTFAIAENVVCGELAGVPHIVLWDSSTGTVKKSNQLGAAWVASGTTAAVTSDCGGVWMPSNGRWILTGIGHVYYSDTLANAAWTDVPIATYTSTPTAIAAGSDGVCFSTASTPTFYSANGASGWTLVNVGTSFISMDYSESHQLWVGLGSDGSVRTAPPGVAAWTSQGTIPVGTPTCIKTFGSYYVVATLSGTVGYVLAAKDPAGPWERVATFRHNTDGVINSLAVSGGKLIAAERFTTAGVAHTYLYMSPCMPFARFP